MKILIVDFFNLVKRYSYRLSDMDEGEFITSLVPNIINKLSFIINENKPDMVFICSDNGKNKRAIAITEGAYKANRKRAKSLTEEEKEKSYIEYIKNIIGTLPFSYIDVRDTEADMIIYCLINYIKKLGNDIDITVVSSDSDFIQLLDNNVSIYDWYKGDIDISNWYIKHTKHKEQYLNSKDYAIAKSITGDTADNILGVKNWGWVKTQKLFNYIYKYHNKNYVTNNVEQLIIDIKDILKKDDIEDSDFKFLTNSLKILIDNKDLINKNQSIIDLSMLEVPYLYNIIEIIKTSLFNSEFKFNNKEFMKLLKINRFSDEDVYEKIKNKFSKSSLMYYQLANKMKNNSNILKKRKEDLNT